MKSFICDPFQVRKLERLVKRPLTEMEREGEVPVRCRMPNGTMHVEWVKKFNMRDFFSK